MWQAETTSAKDRKRLLRLLIQDITVERGPGHQVILHVRWFGGACEELHVTLPAKIQDRLRYPPERIEEIRRLAAEHTDAEIAAVFNQRGQSSSRGQPFTAKMIAWIRWKYRIPTVVLQRRPKEMTVSEVASEFGVAKNVVHYWIQRGVLPARQLGANRPYWITVNQHKEQELRAWVQASKRIHPKPNQETPDEQFPTPIEGGAL